MSFLTSQSPYPGVTITILFFFIFSLSTAELESTNQHVVNVTYHMGPVLTNDTFVHIIWYGNWETAQKQVIHEFINSISGSRFHGPSVSDWWKTAQLYTDKTGSNVSGNVRIGKERDDMFSHGKNLTLLSIQSVIIAAIQAETNPLPVDPKGGIYLLLTAEDVQVESFCQKVCGSHYFISPSIVGPKLPYAWAGNSAKQCPDLCAYPFAGAKPLKSPNGDIGIDGMVNVIGALMARVVTNPFYNGWHSDLSYVEIADMCERIFGAGGGGDYGIEMVMRGDDGAVYNMYGIHRRFLVQWIWDYVRGRCAGPNVSF